MPPTCTYCGGRTRAEAKHEIDEESGEQVTTFRGLIRIPDKIAALIADPELVKELDDEELARGYPRAADGSFRGAPAVVPRQLHQRMVREFFDRANQKLRDGLMDVTDSVVKLSLDPAVDPALRLKASTWIIERLMGKTPEVQVTVDQARYEKVFDHIDRTSIVVQGEVVNDGREA